MILRTFSLLLLILIEQVSTKGIRNYYCGIGPTTKAISYALSSLCGRDKINKCCFKHDKCYDCKYGQKEALKTCDSDFETCIDESYRPNSWICAKFLKFTHSGAVKLFGRVYRDVFGYNPVTEMLQNDSGDNINDIKNSTRQLTRAERDQQHFAEIIELPPDLLFNCTQLDLELL